MSTNPPFEQILDEALTLLQHGKSVEEVVLLFPEYKNELIDLLGVASVLETTKDDKVLRQVLKNTISHLPLFNASMPRPQKQSFFQWLNSKISGPKLMAAGFGMLAMVFVVYAVGNFFINRLVNATTNLSSSSGGHSGLGMATRGDSGIQYAQPTGLASGDFLEGIKLKLGLENSASTMLDDASNNQPSTISDTREFLKTDYHATLKTRDVSALGGRTQTIIRGYGGRVDNVSLDDQSGYISFVVPKEKFEDFKIELKTLVGKRFFVEGVSMENLLPQKQVIEENTSDNTAKLNKLTQFRVDTIKERDEYIGNLNASYARISRAVAALNREASVTTDTIRLVAIARDRAGNESILRDIKKRLKTTQDYYDKQITSLDSQNNYLTTELNNLQKQDQRLADTVATVRGSISLQWVSIYQIISLYIPYWPLWAIAIIVMVYIMVYRRHGKIAVEEVGH